MNCEHCGAEIKEGANFCTQCGMPVTNPVQSQAEPEYKPYDGTGNPVDGYMSYTYSAIRDKAPVHEEEDAAPESGKDWAAGAAIACASLSIMSFLLCVPGVVFGIGAIIFGRMGKRSNLKALAIGSVIGGIIGIILSLGMAGAWIGIIRTLRSFVLYNPSYFW